MVQQGATKYSYDVDSYLASGSHASDCLYSAQGELLSATTTTGQSIAYSYDGMARRVARHDQTGTFQYFYTNPDQPFQLSAVRDPDGTFTAYYYDPYGSLFAFKRGTSTYYVGSDHLGTPRVIADSAGIVVDGMEYDSYGSLLSDTNPTFKLPIGFAGGIVDITGLIRFGFRDYEPGSGRWVSRDPILYSGGLVNLYQYVQGNPVNLKDPFGLDATNWNNSSGGRSLYNGPTNGHWGGKCWSGGQYPCDGHGAGNAPPTDSGDECYERHDNCWYTCGSNWQCLAACNGRLIDELQSMPDDPRQWERPPRPGTEKDSRQFRDLAIKWFSGWSQ